MIDIEHWKRICLKQARKITALDQRIMRYKELLHKQNYVISQWKNAAKDLQRAMQLSNEMIAEQKDYIEHINQNAK